MRVKNAVITAAGERQRRLPLQTIIDVDGVSRTVLAILINEILSAHIEQVCVVVRPGDETAFIEAVPEHNGVLRFVQQREPRGYGDALWQAREFIAGEAFLHLVGDHLYVGGNNGECATTLIQAAEGEDCCVSAVRATHERLLGSFGVVGGQPVARQPGLFRVRTVIEKPTPTVAEQNLIVPGLRAGHYLAFFGMHVLTSSVLDVLDDLLQSPHHTSATLSDALAIVAQKEKYMALQVTAERYDLGAAYGLLSSQIALALSGKDRDEVLYLLVNLLANDQLRTKEQRPQ